MTFLYLSIWIHIVFGCTPVDTRWYFSFFSSPVHRQDLLGLGTVWSLGLLRRVQPYWRVCVVGYLHPNQNTTKLTQQPSQETTGELGIMLSQSHFECSIRLLTTLTFRFWDMPLDFRHPVKLLGGCETRIMKEFPCYFLRFWQSFVQLWLLA